MPPTTPVAPSAATTCDREVFRDVIGHFASGVTVVTTRHRGARFGMTASAVTSLSLDPPMLVVCLNRSAPTRAAVSETGVFGVNILSENDGHLAERFAGPHADKFAGVEVLEGADGVPLLRDALARIECRVAEDVAGGTHSVLLAEVRRAEARQGSPLAYFRGRFGRLELAEDEAAHAELRQQLLDGRFAPGEPLAIAELARRMRCERWHVHHALTRLVAEGLLTREPDRGHVVAPVDLRTIEDALDGRCAIELGAAELTVGRVAAPELAELRRRMEATLPLVRDGRFTDIAAFTQANAALHEHLVGLSGSDALVQAYRRLSIPGLMARTLRRSDVADDGLRDDHRELVEAYEHGDLPRAKAIVRRHAERSKQIHRRALKAADRPVRSVDPWPS
jgi:flavin reductase (DIM6/NTAB) family NADH-FMN oxidoreductase RutF/DNA-binding GntR family transcriptional regulator